MSHFSIALLILVVPVSMTLTILLSDLWDKFTRRHYSWW